MDTAEIVANSVKDQEIVSGIKVGCWAYRLVGSASGETLGEFEGMPQLNMKCMKCPQKDLR
jgi:hypothetical protein